MKKTFCILFIFALLTGCADQTTLSPRVIDGTSETATVESMRLMMNGLPMLEHCQLQVAFARIRLGDATLSDYENLGKRLNGMTAEQVISFSQQYPPLPQAQVQCAP